MNLAPLLHGAAGNLDELLACGVGLAVILVVIFIVESRASKDKGAAGNAPAAGDTPGETVKDEQAH